MDIPVQLECIVLDSDTIAYKMQGSKYKYLIFVDSASCSSCTIKQLPRWLNVVNYATKYPENLSLYFVFESKKEFIEYNRESLLRADIYYPLYLDTATYFRKTNPKIVDNRVNHLMLDSLNRIVLIGDILKDKNVMRNFNNLLMN